MRGSSHNPRPMEVGNGNTVRFTAVQRPNPGNVSFHADGARWGRRGCAATIWRMLSAIGR